MHEALACTALHSTALHCSAQDTSEALTTKYCKLQGRGMYQPAAATLTKVCNITEGEGPLTPPAISPGSAYMGTQGLLDMRLVAKGMLHHMHAFGHVRSHELACMLYCFNRQCGRLAVQQRGPAWGRQRERRLQGPVLPRSPASRVQVRPGPCALMPRDGDIRYMGNTSAGTAGSSSGPLSLHFAHFRLCPICWLCVDR